MYDDSRVADGVDRAAPSDAHRRYSQRQFLAYEHVICRGALEPEDASENERTDADQALMSFAEWCDLQGEDLQRTS